jgi:formate-dependent nitrite reductase cytochrome c552 subunit
MSEQSLDNLATDATDGSQAQATKTYTQEEFDRHMAGLKSSIQKKYEKQFAELGDVEELRRLKTEHEQRVQEQQLKRGEFEKTLQEKAAKWEAELQKRDAVIKEYKVNTPLLSAAAKFRAVAPEQVKSLLATNVRLSADGEVEVVGTDGTVRYTDSGKPVGVEDLVREFLDSNPHFVQSAPSTTNAKSSVVPGKTTKVDVSKLDMTKTEDRALYKEYRKSMGL